MRFSAKMNITKNQQTCDVICKKTCRLQSHERDLYRVCPSKLSKRELENLYFALLENNLEVKKTLHSQQDRLKVLTTKLQRMTAAQRNAAGKEKDCCNSKVLVKEQKEIIADLKKVNDQMAERIRLLNMRLCSAKQFLKRSPLQSSKCPRCGICPVSVKNSSMSAIEPRPSQASVKMTAASCQYIPVDASEVSPKSTREVETETKTDQDENEGTEKQCNENKCRTVMDELKQKIVNLQEELSKTHGEYSKRISKLENDVSGLHQENTRVRSSKAASDHTLQQREKKADDLRGKLREAEGKLNDLHMQLTIEKRKVKELETTLKLANSSNQAVKIMEKLNAPKPKHTPATDDPRLVSSNKLKPGAATDASGSASSYYSVQQDGRAPSPTPCSCGSEQKSDMLSPESNNVIRDDVKLLKSDDSGCTDLNRSSDAEESKSLYMERLNQEMLKKISELQMQLDSFRIKAAGQSAKTDSRKTSDQDYDYENEKQMTVITITDPNVVVEIQELGVEKSDSFPEKDIDTSTPIKNPEVPSKSGKTEPTGVRSWNDTVKAIGKTSHKFDDSRIPIKRSSKDEPNIGESKNDENNRYQIPGPVSTTYETYNDKKKPLKNSKRNSEEKNDKEINLISKKESFEGKCVKIIDSVDFYKVDTKNSDKIKSNLKSDAPVKTNETPIKIDDSSKVQSQKITIGHPKDAVTNDGKKTSDDLSVTFDNIYVDSSLMHPIPVKESKQAEDRINQVKEDVDKIQTRVIHGKEVGADTVEANKEPSTSYFYTIDAKQNSRERTSTEPDKTKHEIIDVRMDQMQQCASRAAVCRCPRAPRRELNVFRTCSGTLCFHTTSGAGDKFRQCDCAPAVESDILEMGQRPPSSTEPKPVQPTVPISAVRPSAGMPSATMSAVPEPSAPRSSVQESALSSAPRSSVQHSVPQSELPSAPRSSVQESALLSAPRSSVQHSAPQSALPSAPRSSVQQSALPSAQPSAPQPSAPQSAPPGRRDSATYTKSEEKKPCSCERATSPANTERDVSSLSDLPPERDGVSPRAVPPSPRDARSPGEEKATSTYTDTDTRTHEYALSDGEVPTHSTLVKPRKLSFGEQPAYYPVNPLNNPVPQSSEAQMEATLNAISAELAHCRKLLAAARDHESVSAGAACSEEGAEGACSERVHRLHAAAASRRLTDAESYAAIFTLHMGTLVLSDEAVLSSRDKSLVLTWQFYDQPAAMTRMRSGRVVLFDFSTEYDVTVNYDLLHYMKQEEMLITICDINKQDEALATCSLPLRDVLINSNRRADMSLALMAGPAFARSGAGTGAAADPLVAGDELGVLDLWCCLRVPSQVTQAINTAIAKSSPDELVRTGSHTEFPASTQSHYEQNRLTQDMLLQPQVLCGAKPFPNRSSDPDEVAADRKWSDDPQISEVAEDPHLEPGRQPSKNSVKSQKSYRTSDELRMSLAENWKSRNRRSSSIMIATEVPANIKSAAEMKEALERNVRSMGRKSKADDEVSQAHASLSSLRNAAEKKRMQKVITPKQTTSRVPEGLQDMLKEERKNSKVAAAAARESSTRKKRVPFSQNSQETDPSVQNKYNDIAQYLGLNKILEQSKKTVTYTDAKISDDVAAAEETASRRVEDQPQSIDITVLWLALNEECEVIDNPQMHRLYVAYTFLGKRGAELETPISLPKPKNYADKCYFNFKKTFHLHDADLPLLGHMSRCRAGRSAADPRDCIVFSVVSEPPEDPLGLTSCEDIGYAYLYLGDILAYSAGGAGYTEVVPVRAARGPGAGAARGVLAVRVDGLQVLRRALTLSNSSRDLRRMPF